jgi:hypothetical protein
VAESVRGTRVPAGRGLHGDVVGLQDRTAGLGHGGEQGVVFCRAQGREAARRLVRGGADADVRPVDMRVRAVAEFVAGGERGRHVGRILAPVRHGDRAENDVPALVGVFDLALQPAGWNHGVGVGGGQPEVQADG